MVRAHQALAAQRVEAGGAHPGRRQAREVLAQQRRDAPILARLPDQIGPVRWRLPRNAPRPHRSATSVAVASGRCGIASSRPTSKPGWSRPTVRTVKHRRLMSSAPLAALSSAAFPCMASLAHAVGEAQLCVGNSAIVVGHTLVPVEAECLAQPFDGCWCVTVTQDWNECRLRVFCKIRHGDS